MGKSLVDRWLPSNFDQISTEEQRQCRAVLAAVAVAIPLTLIRGVLLGLRESWDQMYVTFGITVGTSLAACIVRFSGRGTLATHVGLGSFVLGVCVNCALLGGILSHGIGAVAYLSIAPLAAMLMLGSRSGLIWGGISSVIVLGFSLLGDLIPTQLSVMDHATLLQMRGMDMLVLIAAITALALQFETIKNQLFDALEDKSRVLEEEKAESDRQHMNAVQARQLAEHAHGEAEQARKEIEVLDRQKTHFFQNISHELRTPLTLVLNPLEDAAMDYREDERIQVAERNTRRLLRLVNQLLDFQKLAAGKKNLALEDVNLVRFAWVCGDYVRSACAGRDVGFQVMLNREELTEGDLNTHRHFIQGEIDALEKIVFNYLSNALKFTPAGGDIRLELSTGEQQLNLAVSDTGPGIPKQAQQKLFKLFSQVDGSATREVEGTGLGLALVKELAEAMNGRVGVDSREGEGSRFWAAFPAVAAPAKDGDEVSLEDFGVKPWLLADQTSRNDSEETPDDLESGEGQRVIVVDDLADMRQLIAATLRRSGYRVSTAKDAFEGMDKARAQHPELIITDWMMPRKSGLDLIAEVRADAVLAHVPVVLLTARSDDEGKLLGTEVGADAFLGKPFNEQELCATVRNLLALKEHERELEAAHKQLQEGVLKRYLPPDLVDAIVRGEQQVCVEPDQRAITVLFADLRGFTSATQELRARKMASVLNEYLAAMTRVVFAHGGTIDKFVGDAVMVVFGAPTRMDSTEQARRAVACGLAMQQAMEELSARWMERGMPEITLRVGIHHGPAVVGNFGSEQRLEYTAIGHTVNLASRVESACEPRSVFVTPEVVDYLPEDCVVEAGRFELKGIDGKTRLYKVLPEAADSLAREAA